MLNRIFTENIFVTRIKTNTQYQSIEELELPIDIDQDILKDEIAINNKFAQAIEKSSNTNENKLIVR